MARFTQSEGVPLTANHRSRTRSTRSGRCSVSAWPQALCSRSGATTYTSPRAPSAPASAARPAACTPSSLVTRRTAIGDEHDEEMVGATGFEPATPRPPVWCATGLRHAPTAERGLSQKRGQASRSQARAERGQPLADAAQRARVTHLAQPELELLGLARLGEQALLGALQRQPLVVEQGLDPDHEIDIAPGVDALARGVLLGTEQLELGFPVAEDVGGHARHRLDFADAVVELLGGFRRYAGWLIRCLSPFDGLKVSTLRAVISIESPVCGFRPRRDALRRMRKCPKPTIFTSSLFSKHRKMMSKTDSTTEADCRFESPWAATALMRSFLVTGPTHLLQEPCVTGCLERCTPCIPSPRALGRPRRPPRGRRRRRRARGGASHRSPATPRATRRQRASSRGGPGS